MPGRPAGGLARDGLASQHKAQQAALVNEALTIEGKRLMAIEVRVPTLGESVTEATVATGSRSRATRSRPTRCCASWKPTR
jgi:hypothetical protein